LPLTCDNTNTLVSYLDIINPTLENYIAVRHLGYKGKLNDRAAIERAVYEEALRSRRRPSRNRLRCAGGARHLP